MAFYFAASTGFMNPPVEAAGDWAGLLSIFAASVGIAAGMFWEN